MKKITNVRCKHKTLNKKYPHHNKTTKQTKNLSSMNALNPHFVCSAHLNDVTLYKSQTPKKHHSIIQRSFPNGKQCYTNLFEKITSKLKQTKVNLSLQFITKP